MRKNVSALSPPGPGLIVRSLNSPQHQKKLEGFDKTTASSHTFTSKVQKIRSRPKNESLEEEYVKGLQDEIHYLEMELKLLKEKEIAKHSQVDQLETFFGDGIPINENILALKNGFNSYKLKMDKKINSLETEKKERQGLITSLRVKIEQNCKSIHDEQKKYKKELTTMSAVTHDKVKQEILLKNQIEFEEQTLKAIKSQNKQIADFAANLGRAKQLLYVSIMRSDSNKYNKLNKLRQSISQKQIQCEKLNKISQQLRKQDEENSYVINLQQNNIKLKKKIISLEKELNALNIKCSDKKLDLEAKLKERIKEINARLDMQTRLDKIKEEIQNQNNMTMEELEKTAREGEAKILEAILEKNKKLSKYADYYGDLLYKIEEKLYQFGQKKPDLKRQLQLYQNQVKIAQKQLDQQRERHCILNSQIAKNKSKGEHIQTIVPPTLQQMKKEEQKIKALKTQRERLAEEIKLKEKQLELMEILKCLSLEEIQISSSSNSSIQDRLLDFMRNWDMLARK